jgi:hypothetical protein
MAQIMVTFRRGERFRPPGRIGSTGAGRGPRERAAWPNLQPLSRDDATRCRVPSSAGEVGEPASGEEEEVSGRLSSLLHDALS